MPEKFWTRGETRPWKWSSDLMMVPGEPLQYPQELAPVLMRQLSYATTTLHATVAEAESQPQCFSVKVVNAAGRRMPSGMVSDVVVLAFIDSKLPDAPRNPKLCDFVREAAVKPGEQRDVKICADAIGALALVDAGGNQRVLPGEYTITVGVKGGVGGAGAGSVVGKLVITA